MWGDAKDQLKSDVHVPNESGFLPAYTVLDNRQMVNINRKSEMPLVFDVHGKKDITISWSPWIIEWYDSLQNNHVGGVFYWDQRNHSGNGKNFENEETTPDFYRYQTNKSYPAFSHCTIDQNPGNGTSTNGDPFGALNGYLDWDDDITDNKCDYTITVMVKNQYVGGGLGQEQYTTCKTDITFRNQQNFHPVNGASINWKNYNDDNDLIQSGSLNYGDGPITLKAVTVNKSGNRIELKINSCQRVEGSTLESPKPQMFFTHSSNGYTAHVDVIADQNSSLYVYDLMGRVMMNKKVYLQAGSNDFEIPAFGSGIFIIELRGDFFTDTKKLFF
jgi:hypothetical protein